MKSQILLLAVIVALSSCTSAYKTGQTPDDVYFSPTQPQDEYAQVEKKDNRRYEGSDDYYDDRYLRMRVNNRYRWSELDDWYYYGGRYDYSYYNVHNWNNPWTPCGYWNAYYNPYYPGHIVVNPGKPKFNGPRITNLNTYNNSLLTNNNYTNPKTPKNGVRIFNNTGSGNSGRSNNYNSGADRNSGNSLRDLFNNNNSRNNNNSNSNSNSGRSTNTSSGSSNSNSGSSGGSAPVRRF